MYANYQTNFCQVLSKLGRNYEIWNWATFYRRLISQSASIFTGPFLSPAAQNSATWQTLPFHANSSKISRTFVSDGAQIQGVLRNQFRFETTETCFGTIRTKSLFQLFRYYTETASFGVSIEPKQTEDQRNRDPRAEIETNNEKCFPVMEITIKRDFLLFFNCPSAKSRT